MKKLFLLAVNTLFVLSGNAQDMSDALRYAQDEIQGSARFRAMSGAFGALGGDMSAVSLNPAGSAVFNLSHISFSVSNLNSETNTQFFEGTNNSTDSNFDFNQVGAAFVFVNNNNKTPWRKFSIGFAYDKTADYNTDWFAHGTNTNSIDSYFLDYANGLRLDEISAFAGETYSDAYSEIGSAYGYGNQQAFLGYESYILEPDADTDANTIYYSNIAPGTFNQEYALFSTGYNGKMSFNFATQYKDHLYLGVNLNSHFINYEKVTYFSEGNTNTGSLITDVNFENSLYTRGAGFSFQIGGIAKITNELRAGLTYNSPIWYNIEDETTQYISTLDDQGGTTVIDPQIVNLFERYTIQTPAKLTGSLAYVFGAQGLISFDYSVKNYANTKFKPKDDPYFSAVNSAMSEQLTNAATYRLGGEYKFKQWSFRGGYRFEESPYENGITIGDLSGYSLGLGYDFGNTRLDLTYDQFSRDVEQQLYDAGQVGSALLENQNSNITLSLNFNL